MQIGGRYAGLPLLGRPAASRVRQRQRDGDWNAVVEQHAEAKRRSDARHVRLSGRDVRRLVLCAEHYAPQYDLLATALGVESARLRGIVARWRNAGLVQTGTRLRPRLVLADSGLATRPGPRRCRGWRTSGRSRNPVRVVSLEAAVAAERATRSRSVMSLQRVVVAQPGPHTVGRAVRVEVGD